MRFGKWHSVQMGTMLASVGEGSPQVILWNVNTRAVVRTISIDAGDHGADVAWSPDGQILAVGSLFPATIHLYDPNTGTRKYRLSHGTRTGGSFSGFDIAFHPNGRYLAVVARTKLSKFGKGLRLIRWMSIKMDRLVSVTSLR